MFKCINCGHKTAMEVSDRFVCGHCNHSWDEEEEQRNARRIFLSLGRKPRALSKQVVEAKAIETGDVDDLKVLDGVGEIREKQLNAAGVFNFRQLVNSSVAKLVDSVSNATEQDVEKWVRQAFDLLQEPQPDEIQSGVQDVPGELGG